MSSEPQREPEPLALVEDHELADARLRSRATVALSQLAGCLDQGEASRQRVVALIRTTFCSGSGADELDQPPETGPSVEERLEALLADSAVVDRIMAAIPGIVADARL